MAFLATMQAKIIAGLLAVALIWGGIAYIRSDAKKDGANEIKAKVATETIRTMDKARQEKEQSNEAVRSKSIDAVIDGLR